MIWYETKIVNWLCMASVPEKAYTGSVGQSYRIVNHCEPYKYDWKTIQELKEEKKKICISIRVQVWQLWSHCVEGIEGNLQSERIKLKLENWIQILFRLDLCHIENCTTLSYSIEREKG